MLEQAPMEMHHFGSGIWSQMRLRTGAILRVTVPATIMRSDWRGLGRNTSAPKRAISNREVDEAIISIAQQAKPNVSGQIADFRAQLKTQSTEVVTKFCSNWFWMNDTLVAPLQNDNFSRSPAAAVPDAPAQLHS